MLTQVGGLGDVVTGLGRACLQRGHAVSVILPFYECLPEAGVQDLTRHMDFNCPKVRARVELEIRLAWYLEQPCSISSACCLQGKSKLSFRVVHRAWLLSCSPAVPCMHFKILWTSRPEMCPWILPFFVHAHVQAHRHRPEQQPACI